jgi:hypothetical protein
MGLDQTVAEVRDEITQSGDCRARAQEGGETRNLVTALCPFGCDNLASACQMILSHFVGFRRGMVNVQVCTSAALTRPVL